MDPVEELRRAIVEKDMDRAETLIGPVWNERDGLHRALARFEVVGPGHDEQTEDQHAFVIETAREQGRREAVAAVVEALREQGRGEGWMPHAFRFVAGWLDRNPSFKFSAPGGTDG